MSQRFAKGSVELLLLTCDDSKASRAAIHANYASMRIDPSGLRGLIHKSVRLTFRDGEVVDAIVLGVNIERDFDLTYEVLRVIHSAQPPALGTAPGATVIAELKDLVGWEPGD